MVGHLVGQLVGHLVGQLVGHLVGHWEMVQATGLVHHALKYVMLH